MPQNNPQILWSARRLSPFMSEFRMSLSGSGIDPARVDKLYYKIKRIALSHQTRSRHFHLDNDQFLWATAISGILGCTSSLEGLSFHRSTITEEEANLIQKIYRKHWIETSDPGVVYTNPNAHIISVRILRQVDMYVDITHHSRAVTSVFQCPFNHDEAVAEYELAVARSRASERSPSVRFQRLPGDPRGSDKSVLHSRWSRRNDNPNDRF